MKGSSLLMDRNDKFSHRSCSLFCLFNAHSMFGVEHTAASMLQCSGLSSLCRKLCAKGDTWSTLSFFFFMFHAHVGRLRSYLSKHTSAFGSGFNVFLDARDDLVIAHQIYAYIYTVMVYDRFVVENHVTK